MSMEEVGLGYSLHYDAVCILARVLFPDLSIIWKMQLSGV